MIGSRHGTVKEPTELRGIGVHSGEESILTVRPAPEGRGIVFRRTDLEGNPEVPADLDHVADTDLGTTLSAGEGLASVHTVEHVLAALYMGGVTNAVVDLHGAEPPILDGSFQPYLEALKQVGTREQEGSPPVLKVRRPFTVETGKGASYVAAPANDFRASVTIDFPHPAIGRQFGSFALDPETFARELAPARTFGFREEAEALRERGLARGSSLENTIVLDADGVMNDGLRFPDEFLRHKVGDLVGDLALLGARIEGHLVAERPSHLGNVKLARTLLEETRRSAEGEAIVDAQKILQYLPHRYPMLLVDRVTHFEAGKRIVGSRTSR
jgi:UDP-3-O-[3-hydroxymyristoyl] N-acetylglucosamine deacetylase / 3-hydroxyacyl-[acyl-carrier-protein] dehydratase